MPVLSPGTPRLRHQPAPRGSVQPPPKNPALLLTREPPATAAPWAQPLSGPCGGYQSNNRHLATFLGLWLWDAGDGTG